MAAQLKSALKVSTLNVRGFVANRRQYQLNRLLLERDVDIIAVQETMIESDQQTERMISHFRALHLCVPCRWYVRRLRTPHTQQLGRARGERMVSEDVCDFVFCQYTRRIVGISAPNKQNERKMFFKASKSISSGIDRSFFWVILNACVQLTIE